MVAKHFLKLPGVAKIPAAAQGLTKTTSPHNSLESPPDWDGCNPENPMRDTIQAIPGRYRDDYEPPRAQDTMNFVHAELIGRQILEHAKANNVIETG
jgi:hypothetical protein